MNVFIQAVFVTRMWLENMALHKPHEIFIARGRGACRRAAETLVAITCVILPPHNIAVRLSVLLPYLLKDYLRHIADPNLLLASYILA